MTLAARLVAGQIESRLRPRAASRIGSVLSCARNVASTLQSAGWVALRSSLNVAASCPSLMRELYATRDGRQALDSRVTRVGTRLLNQEGSSTCCSPG